MLEGIFTRHAETYWYIHSPARGVDPATGMASSDVDSVFSISAVPLPVDEKLVASGQAKATDEDLIVNASDFGDVIPLPGDLLDKDDRQWMLQGAEAMHWNGGTEFYLLHVRLGG